MMSCGAIIPATITRIKGRLSELRKRWPRRFSRAVASRQRSRNSGGMPRLAAEISDIFLPLARNDVRNDDGWVLLPFVLRAVAREGLTTGVVRHACRHRVTARGVFGFVGGRCCRLF